MRKALFLIASAWLAFAAGCGGSKPKDLVIGTWESTEVTSKGEMLEFRSDGTLTVQRSADGKKMETRGKYKFLEDELVELELEDHLAALDPKKPKTATKKIKIKVTQDELTTTYEDGVVVKAKRVK